MNKKYHIIIILLLLISLIYTYICVNKDYKSNYNGNEEQFICYIKNISYDEDKIKLILYEKEKFIGIYYLKEDEKINLNLNDKVKIIGNLEIPNQNTIPNTFNYRKYLYNNRIFYILKISSITKIKDNDNLFYKLKNAIISKIETFKSKKYLYTFILGNNDYIESEINGSYQINGINHLFSVSGMHVTFLSSIIIFLLTKVNKNQIINQLIVSLLLLLYMFLVDFTPSASRSVILYILILINKNLKLKIKTIYLLIITFSILLLFDPFYIYNIGFIYSFTITFYLILLSEKLKSKNYFLSILKVSFVSFIVSIPISLYNFYQLNFLSIIYNLLFVPLISLIIFPLSFIVYFFPFLDNLYYLLILVVNEISLFLSLINFNLIFIKPNFIMVIIYYILITIMFYKKIISIFLLIYIFSHYNYNFIFLNNYFTYLDVGQADANLLNINKNVVLIDTGYKNEYVANNLITYFKSKGIIKIDAMIITHGDLDHIGNAEYLLENFKVEKVIFNCGEFNELEQELIKVLDKKKIPYYSCIKELNIDDNKLYFLNNKDYGNENDNASVIYTELNNYKFLFMGDAGLEVEQDLIEKYNLQDIDVLKVGHHGSKTSSSKNFIESIQPKYGVISVGKNNRYGHPNDSVLDNLEDSKIYRTDQDGSIMFKIKNNKLKINTCPP